MPDSTRDIILIVDDTPTNLEVLQELLDSNGYEVLVAVDGEGAFSQAEYAQPQLILLDVMMPGWDGFETCRRLKDHAAVQNIPVIFMTALSETVDKVRGFQLGAVDYITKPLQHEEVLARVKTHLTLNKLKIRLEKHNEELERCVEARTNELSRLNEIYERFVPREFIKFLNKESILDIQLGDQVQQEMTVLFCDIHGWTTTSEKLTPQQNFDFINDYFRLVSPIVRKHRGFIDQYYGDGVMALFPAYAEDAVDAAIEIQHSIKAHNETTAHPITVGAGLHTGSLMLGIVGEERRMQGAVVSDNVNLAARLEGLTRIYSSSIIISEQTLKKLQHPAQYQSRFVDKVQVKGKSAPVAVFEIYDNDDEMTRLKIETRETFEEGLRFYYDRKFAESSVRFNQVTDANPTDRAARLYLERSATYMIKGVPEDWQGVVTLKEK